MTRALLSRLLRRVFHTDDAARSIVGDLEEEYAARSRVDATAASRWYRREALAVLMRASQLARARHAGAREIAAMAAGKDRGRMMRHIATDAKLALRSLLKQPRFVVIATATLALGIGLVTAIFSVVNGVLLQPLPYPSRESAGERLEQRAGSRLRPVSDLA